MKSEPAPGAEQRLVVGLQPVREAVRVHGSALDRVLGRLIEAFDND